MRDLNRMKAFVDQGVAELGRLEFVLANAASCPGSELPPPRFGAFLDAVDVMLTGVYFTIEASLPPLLERGEGGSAIVITSSAAAFKS